jgi:hypothetical protein
MLNSLAPSRRRGVWLYLAAIFFAINDALGKWLIEIRLGTELR